MADSIVAIVRIIDFEPKADFLAHSRVYARIVLRPRSGPELEAYTADPILQTALLSAWRPAFTPDAAVIYPPLIEVQYQRVGEINEVVRVTFDYDRNQN